MQSKKKRTKQRRRAQRLADQAWEAVEADDYQLALKIARRAANIGIGNPRIWNDLGMICALNDIPSEAIAAFQSAISLAPEFPEPYAHMAELAAKNGNAREAARFMQQAVECDLTNAVYHERWELLRASAELEANITIPDSTVAESNEPSEFSQSLTDKLHQRNWPQVADGLLHNGLVRIERMLDEAVCKQLVSMYEIDRLFAKTVRMNKPSFGKGEYKYFRAPIPKIVRDIRESVYPFAAHVVNEWWELLGIPERFPDEWGGLRNRCHQAGQTTPTPLMLRYPVGGFNALHRDLRGEVYFPLQLAIVLNRHQTRDDSSAGFTGGKFV
ncbi:MAG: 2OG-Fe(II) oxygenase, partial [Planctomycetota bacterium]